LLFSSFEFVVYFLPLVLIAFGVIASHQRRFAVGKILLIVASAFFYAWWSLRDALILGVLVLANYAFSVRIIKYRELERLRTSRLLAVFGVALNLAVLMYFKYANLLVTTLYGLGGASAPRFDIVLPLGISFFTFQKIAFLVDSYKTKLPRQSFSSFALFVSFFPQLIAGPIVHHREMMPQFDRARWRRRWSVHLSVGMTLFVIGLAKKVLIADSLSPFVGPVFAAADQGLPISGIEAWASVLAYTFQLYFDFSGYSDMALGLARCFGIVLPANFYSPYQARSIVDFWRRWHITLSRFLRDYLYIPFGGNRHGRLRRYINLLATMAIGGLWHGASWTFLLWGTLHGLALGLNHWLRESVWPRVPLRLPGPVAWLLTIGFVVLAWIPFRAATFQGAAAVLGSVAGLEGFLPVRLLDQLGPLGGRLQTLASDASLVLSMRDWALSGAPTLVLASVIALFGPNSLQIMRRYTPALKMPETAAHYRWVEWRPTGPWMAGTLLLLTLCVLKLSDVSEFLYFQF